MVIVWGVAFLVLTAGADSPLIYSDADGDCYYIPQQLKMNRPKIPALIIFKCNGATKDDIDTLNFIPDSLEWAIATCHASRSHHAIDLNDRDIVKTINKLLKRFPAVDSNWVFIYGFSSRGVQALATMLLHPYI